MIQCDKSNTFVLIFQTLLYQCGTYVAIGINRIEFNAAYGVYHRSIVWYCYAEIIVGISVHYTIMVGALEEYLSHLAKKTL